MLLDWHLLARHLLRLPWWLLYGLAYTEAQSSRLSSWKVEGLLSSQQLLVRLSFGAVLIRESVRLVHDSLVLRSLRLAQLSLDHHLQLLALREDFCRVDVALSASSQVPSCL